jgi:hypothetical protein
MVEIDLDLRDTIIETHTDMKHVLQTLQDHDDGIEELRIQHDGKIEELRMQHEDRIRDLEQTQGKIMAYIIAVGSVITVAVNAAIQIGAYPFVFNIGNNEIEVGDKKADHFKPHAKLKRWGSECFLDIEFPTGEKKDPIEEDGKVKWGDEDKEIHFYTIVNKQKTIEGELSESYTRAGECNQCGACCEFYQGGKTCYLGDGVCRNYEKRLDRCKEYPTIADLYMHKFPSCGYSLEKRETPIKSSVVSGADIDCFEFEVILKKKPATNVIQFNIETNNLKFYYQPELTQEEIDTEHFRPENAIGSYAVYHESKKNNEYKTGKAFHIFRPRIIDSIGNEVWGELNISTEEKTLTVTIPQEFLDAAAYPVRHAAGLTFGYTGEGLSVTSFGAHIKGSVFTTPAGSTIEMDDIQAYCEFGGTIDYYRYAIYLHGDSSQVANSLTPSTQASTAKQWWPLSYGTKPSLTASTAYVLVCGAYLPKSFQDIYYDSGDANQGHYESITYPTFPATASFTHDNNKYSIYCNYTPVASAIPVIVHHLKEQGIL